MNILITAGGTSEKIDSVRAITNHSTGRLGQKIAEAFLLNGHTVTYITTPRALRPSTNERLRLVEVETTKELAKTIHTLSQHQLFDSIIHSMAVSDFTTETTFSEDAFLDALSEKLAATKEPLPHDSAKLKMILRDQLDTLGNFLQTEKKISSKSNRLLLFLKKNPKIIAMLRELQPQAIIVGFKLLVDVSEAELLRVAHTILVKNQCDFVLANDFKTIQNNQHFGYLLNESGVIGTAETKTKIAQLLTTTIEKNWRDKQ